MKSGVEDYLGRDVYEEITEDFDGLIDKRAEIEKAKYIPESMMRVKVSDLCRKSDVTNTDKY